jgi:hypothetical protein
MGQMCQCWWSICREINIFPRFEYHMFYVLYPLVFYFPTPPRRIRTTVHLKVLMDLWLFTLRLPVFRSTAVSTELHSSISPQICRSFYGVITLHDAKISEFSLLCLVIRLIGPIEMRLFI